MASTARRFVTAAFVSMVTAATFAGTTPNADIDIPFQKFVLANGLTLIVHEDAKAPIVAVNVWYHVGSKDEKPGKTGFAHLFEHLMFNGSEHFNDDYFKALERVGATDRNGTTNADRTNYFQNVPKTALDTVLWLESDRMGHLLAAIDQAKLDEQRGVVQNEKRQGENQPYGRVFTMLAESSYPPGHPYSWTTIGSMADLDAASLEDVHEWFRSSYGAANATLVIAGDVRADEVRERVEHYFGDIPAGPPLVRRDEWIAKRTGTPAPHDAGPRAPGPDLQELERPGLGHRRGRPSRPRRRPAGARQELSALPAAGLRGPDRQRRRRLRHGARDRGPVHAPGQRRPWRRPGTRRAGDRRGAARLPRRRSDSRRARARPDQPPSAVRARHGAHRRLRRQVRHPGAEPGLRRRPRRLSGLARARRQRNARTGGRHRARLARRR